MKALILNSGMGTRMAPLTDRQPKCLTELSPGETILGRQLRQLAEAGIQDVTVTTGPFPGVLEEYCEGLNLPLRIRFVRNAEYGSTNYIYSIYLARSFLEGDLVFENEVLQQVIRSEGSCVTVSSTAPLPEKDFKAVVRRGRVEKVGVEFFEDAMAAQPLYHLRAEDWSVWLQAIAQIGRAHV